LANRVSLAESHVLLTGDRPGRCLEVDPVRIACWVSPPALAFGSPAPAPSMRSRHPGPHSHGSASEWRRQCAPGHL